MKIFRNFIALVLAVVAFSFVSVNAQVSVTGTAQSIERQVQKKILRLPYYEVFDYIGFNVNGDTVTLVGKVRNARNRKDAEAYVRDVPGVRNVVNNIEVLPLGSFDDSIRVNLYRTLAQSGGLSRYLWTVNPSVRLVVDRGNVSLEGYVANRGDYNTMNVLAHGVSGVFSVTNNLVIDNERAN